MIVFKTENGTNIRKGSDWPSSKSPHVCDDWIEVAALIVILKAILVLLCYSCFP